MDTQATPTEIARALAALRPVKKVTCPVCGQPVEGRGRRQYCSNKCVAKAYRARRRAGALCKDGPSGAS